MFTAAGKISTVYLVELIGDNGVEKREIVKILSGLSSMRDNNKTRVKLWKHFRRSPGVPVIYGFYANNRIIRRDFVTGFHCFDLVISLREDFSQKRLTEEGLKQKIIHAQKAYIKARLTEWDWAKEYPEFETGEYVYIPDINRSLSNVIITDTGEGYKGYVINLGNFSWQPDLKNEEQRAAWGFANLIDTMYQCFASINPDTIFDAIIEHYGEEKGKQIIESALLYAASNDLINGFVLYNILSGFVGKICADTGYRQEPFPADVDPNKQTAVVNSDYKIEAINNGDDIPVGYYLALIPEENRRDAAGISDTPECYNDDWRKIRNGAQGWKIRSKQTNEIEGYVLFPIEGDVAYLRLRYQNDIEREVAIAKEILNSENVKKRVQELGLNVVLIIKRSYHPEYYIEIARTLGMVQTEIPEQDKQDENNTRCYKWLAFLNGEISARLLPMAGNDSIADFYYNLGQYLNMIGEEEDAAYAYIEAMILSIKYADMCDELCERCPALLELVELLPAQENQPPMPITQNGVRWAKRASKGVEIISGIFAIVVLFFGYNSEALVTLLAGIAACGFAIIAIISYLSNLEFKKLELVNRAVIEWGRSVDLTEGELQELYENGNIAVEDKEYFLNEERLNLIKTRIEGIRVKLKTTEQLEGKISQVNVDENEMDINLGYLLDVYRSGVSLAPEQRRVSFGIHADVLLPALNKVITHELTHFGRISRLFARIPVFGSMLGELIPYFVTGLPTGNMPIPRAAEDEKDIAKLVISNGHYILFSAQAVKDIEELTRLSCKHAEFEVGALGVGAATLDERIVFVERLVLPRSMKSRRDIPEFLTEDRVRYYAEGCDVLSGPNSIIFTSSYREYVRGEGIIVFEVHSHIDITNLEPNAEDINSIRINRLHNDPIIAGAIISPGGICFYPVTYDANSNQGLINEEIVEPAGIREALRQPLFKDFSAKLTLARIKYYINNIISRLQNKRIQIQVEDLNELEKLIREAPPELIALIEYRDSPAPVSWYLERLINEHKSPEVVKKATEVKDVLLGKIGPADVRALIRALEEPEKFLDVWERNDEGAYLAFVVALGKIGPAAAAAIPVLTQMLEQRDDWYTRQVINYVLTQIEDITGQQGGNNDEPNRGGDVLHIGFPWHYFLYLQTWVKNNIWLNIKNYFSDEKKQAMLVIGILGEIVTAGWVACAVISEGYDIQTAIVWGGITGAVVVTLLFFIDLLVSKLWNQYNIGERLSANFWIWWYKRNPNYLEKDINKLSLATLNKLRAELIQRPDFAPVTTTREELLRYIVNIIVDFWDTSNSQYYRQSREFFEHSAMSKLEVTADFNRPKSYNLLFCDIISTIVTVEGKRLLELGCAQGCAIELLSRKTQAEVIGVEKEQSFVDYAKEHGVNVIQGELPQIPDELKGQHFDVTFSNRFLEALEEGLSRMPHREAIKVLSIISKLTKEQGFSIHVVQDGFPFFEEEIIQAGFDIIAGGAEQSHIILKKVRPSQLYEPIVPMPTSLDELQRTTAILLGVAPQKIEGYYNWDFAEYISAEHSSYVADEKTRDDIILLLQRTINEQPDLAEAAHNIAQELGIELQKQRNTPLSLLPTEKVSELVPMLRETLALKKERRIGWVNNGIERPESVADHSAGVLLLAVMLYHLYPELHLENALISAVIHDLSKSKTGEFISSDAVVLPEDGNVLEKDEKLRREIQAFREILSVLPGDKQELLQGLFGAYNELGTAEGCFVRMCDSLEMALQANHYQQQPGKDLHGFIEYTENEMSEIPEIDEKYNKLHRLNRLLEEADELYELQQALLNIMRLKNIKQTYGDINYEETVTEHIWGVCWVAVALHHLQPEPDLRKVLLMIVLNTLEQVAAKDNSPGEAVLNFISEKFPDVFEQYEGNNTPEFQFLQECNTLYDSLQPDIMTLDLGEIAKTEITPVGLALIEEAI
ncbi:MAG: HD domain-containing protein [Candidatus Omnitrophota bacterium]